MRGSFGAGFVLRELLENRLTKTRSYVRSSDGFWMIPSEISARLLFWRTVPLDSMVQQLLSVSVYLISTDFPGNRIHSTDSTKAHTDSTNFLSLTSAPWSTFGFRFDPISVCIGMDRVPQSHNRKNIACSWLSYLLILLRSNFHFPILLLFERAKGQYGKRKVR